MSRAWIPVVLNSILSTTGCGAELPVEGQIAERVLRGATLIEILSVDAGLWNGFGYGEENTPSPFLNSENAVAEGDGVFGRVTITDKDEITEIAEGFVDGYAEEGPSALCYIPHHVVVATAGEERVHIHLCFQCHYAVVIHEGTEAGRYVSFQDDGLAKTLNRLLIRGGVPVVVETGPAMTPLDEAGIADALSPEQRAIIEAPNALTVFSIDPTFAWRDAAKDAASPMVALELALYEQEQALGKTQIARAGVRIQIGHDALAMMRRGAKQARCFMPRHALLFEKGEQKVCLLVCFQCTNLAVIDAAGMKPGYVGIEDKPGLKERLNAIFGRRGVPVAP